jgi:flagella basal body P-ring formation protein FlgA
MNRDKWICLLGLFLLTILSTSLTADDRLDTAIIEKVRQHYQLNDSDVEIIVRKNRLTSTVDNCDILTVDPLTQGEPRGVISVRVSLQQDGELIEQGQVRLRISHFDSVLVADHLIRRHDHLSPTSVSKKRKEVTYQTDRPLQDISGIEGLWAKRNINPDQIITDKIVEEIPVIKQHHTVKIVCTNPLFEVSVLGTAMEAGSRGEIIRVKNSQSNKIIAATVVDESTVAVSAP